LGDRIEFPLPPDSFRVAWEFVVSFVMIDFHYQAYETIVPRVEAYFDSGVVADEDQSTDSLEIPEKLDYIGCEVK